MGGGGKKFQKPVKIQRRKEGERRWHLWRYRRGGVE